MKFLIITQVEHVIEQNNYFAYAPYVSEMNIWAKYTSKLTILAPISSKNKSNIDLDYKHSNIQFIAVKSFNLLNAISIFKSILNIPKIVIQIFFAMKQVDHIHLRCPGNMGLLGAIVQIFFPNKKKTAKYAGNWDPKAKNPLSYKLQKWILSNAFLTKNMQVLVYGEWQNQTKNIKPFFTATYKESDKKEIKTRDFNNQTNFLFVGMLTKGKNPLYAIQLIEKLQSKFKNLYLTIYGEGTERNTLENYIEINNLEDIVALKGNQNFETLKTAYAASHFMILPSESEGWPKAVAEAMFWGCLPVSKAVSCVANMLDYGNRGILLDLIIENDAQAIEKFLNNEVLYQQKVLNAANWSRKYTLDYFEQEIKLLLQE